MRLTKRVGNYVSLPGVLSPHYKVVALRNCPICGKEIPRRDLSPWDYRLIKTCGRRCGRLLSSQEQRRQFEQHFWDRVDRSGGADACWPWLGCRNPLGYGVVRTSSFGERTRNYLAHHMALCLVLKRPLRPGYDGCHRCDNPPCCNPAHLWEGTHKENMQDAARKGRWSKPKEVADGTVD